MTARHVVRLGLAAALATAPFIAAPPAMAQPARESANGHGTLLVTGTSGLVRRQFSFNAERRADGTVTGHATLINPAFKGANGKSPYQLDVDISCMHIVGNIAIMGGSTKRTNDPSLVDAVFFTVQDNGEPGAGRDRISRAFFWNDDPGTQGPPAACLNTGPNDFLLEPIESGNVQVRP
jgi:hypothetical protein